MQIWLNYLDQILILAAMALSLNLLLGYTGQVSVAHAAFAAMGGYAVGYLGISHGWAFVPSALVGGGVAFIAGALVALPALKLSEEYLILFTLAMSSVIIGVFTTFPELGGTFGLTEIPNPDIFGWTMDQPGDWVIPALVLVAISFALCHRLGESAFGRVLKGIREDAEATQSLGKNVFAYKVGVFGITAGLAGLAGAFYSGWLQLATPGVFGFSFGLTLFAIVIFGGMGNLYGSIVGAAAVTLLEPLLRRVIQIDATTASLVQLIVYGLALVLLMMLRPQGLLPEGFSLRRRSAASPRVHQPDAGELDEIERDSERIREEAWQQAPVVLEARGLSKRFGGIVATEDLDFELREGTITALVGPNGAGKTTVFNLLTGFVRPDAGSVKLNGTELVGLSPDKVARLGLVRSFQDVRLFNRISCLQNVMLAVPNQAGENLGKLLAGGRLAGRVERETRDKAMEWLAFVGMAEFADAPGAALSYGQTKLVAMARVLASEADVLLFDEPAAGIDTRWVSTILALVEAVREQGRTVCIVEHNLDVVGRLADHTYFMELGRITAEGTIDELAGSAELAEAYFGSV